MTVQSFRNNPETDLRDPLLQSIANHAGLDRSDLESIRDYMLSHQVGFEAAAVELQLVTPVQLEEVRKLALNSLGNNDSGIGIIETARRKMVLGRSPTRHAFAKADEQCILGDKLVIAHEAFCEHSEKIRGLRTELMLRFGTSNQASMFAVVSPGSGEGRSRLVAELAVAFAQLERKTLLVDADFRRPSIHTYFGCHNDRGLSEAINEDAPQHLFGTDTLPFLRVLTTGTSPAGPIETLSSKAFERLVANWRYEYDYVLFDTPPLSVFADALTVVSQVKRVLLTTRAHQTNMTAIKEMTGRLSFANAEVLGAILNHF